MKEPEDRCHAEVSYHQGGMAHYFQLTRQFSSSLHLRWHTFCYILSSQRSENKEYVSLLRYFLLTLQSEKNEFAQLALF